MIRTLLSSITTRTRTTRLSLRHDHQRKITTFLAAGSTGTNSSNTNTNANTNVNSMLNHSRNTIRNSSTSTHTHTHKSGSRSGSGSSYRNNNNKHNSSNHHNRHRNNFNSFNGPPSLGPKTEWILVSDIPHHATIEDLLVDIERIMKTELQTGIVDLDAAEQLLLNQIQNDIHIWDGESEDGDGDGGKSQSGEGEGEGESEGDDYGPLPLWIPPSPSDDENSLPLPLPLPPHMVIEAHILLSKKYRPTGWHLRLPNRSCVHALLCHIEQAEMIRNVEMEKMKKMTKKMKMKNKEMKKTKNRRRKKKEEEEEEEELEEQDYDEMSNNIEQGQQQQQQQQQQDGDDGDDDDELGITQEVPEFSWMNYDTRPLRCLWKEVQVSPLYLKDGIHSTKTEWIDETVIRVENCPPESTEDDIRYMFSSFDLKDGHDNNNNNNNNNNLDDNNEKGNDNDNDNNDSTSSWMLPTKKRLDGNAVQLVVKGTRAYGSNKKDKYYNKKDLSQPYSNTSIYLVKFNSPSDARMAVTVKQHMELMGHKLRLSRFSNQIFLNK